MVIVVEGRIMSVAVVQCHGDSGVGQGTVCGCRVISWRQWYRSWNGLWLSCNVMATVV